jgi:uncharacterized phiE125 gp8 family phage protein
MPFKLKTGPTLEPISISDLKKFMQIISSDIADEDTPYSSIAPGSREIGELTGTVVDTAGYNVYFQVDSRTNGEGGTIDLTIMESNDQTEWEEWSGGSFAQITTENDNRFHKLTYTGNKRYLRIDATIAGAACEFGANIVLVSPTSADDDIILDTFKAVRSAAEEYQNKCYLPQTWYLILDRWPAKDYIEVRKLPVRAITSIKYTDADGTEHTFSNTLYYLDDRGVKEFPRITLNYGQSWPSETLKPSGAIAIELEMGFADLATYQAQMSKTTDHWMKVATKKLYFNREMELTPQNISFRALDIDAVRVPFA